MTWKRIYLEEERNEERMTAKEKRAAVEVKPSRARRRTKSKGAKRTQVGIRLVRLYFIRALVLGQDTTPLIQQMIGSGYFHFFGRVLFIISRRPRIISIKNLSPCISYFIMNCESWVWTASHTLTLNKNSI